jgi:hypothetical protein
MIRWMAVPFGRLVNARWLDIPHSNVISRGTLCYADWPSPMGTRPNVEEMKSGLISLMANLLFSMAKCMDLPSVGDEMVGY